MNISKTKLKKELWQKAEKALYTLYGDMPDIRILNRFYSEKMAFGNSDVIILWNLAGEIMCSAPTGYSMPNVTGTTGSCFTAYLLGATSDNPLPIHYHCRECGSTEFVDIKNALPFDLSNKTCSCGAKMQADGFDIPYEMNLGDAHTPHICFSVPKIFLEEAKHLIFEQMKAYYRVGELGNETDYTRFVLLPHDGQDHFKENVNLVNDKYNGFPTVTVVSFLGFDKAKRLIEETGEDLFVFSNSENYLSDERIVEKIASGDIAGIPILDLHIEGFASMKDALKLAKPKNTYEILKVYAALHGSGTWTGNAGNLIRGGIDIADIPTSRDDIFMLLRNKLYDAGYTYTGIAYELTNKIKWGKLDADSRALLEYLDLPEWFIPYAEKIQYMFPKAHSVQNLRTALAFMRYKINYPEEFEMCVQSRLKMRKEISKKTKSLILGHAVADALGVPAEFRDRDALLTNPVTDMIGYGTYNIPRGTWSDDTSMSLAALDSLASGEIDYDDIMQNFVKWCFENKYTANNETFDIGRTCFNAISLYKDPTAKNPIACGMSDEYSNGNGSLMRINPFVIYLYYKNMDIKEKLEVIHNASSLTHAHERSKIACGIYSFVLWELLGAPYKDYIQKGLRKAKEYYRDSIEFSKYHRLFNGIEDLTIDEIKSSGYVVDTLEAAIWCVLTTKDYKECVLRAVNLGGDTDTIAAIAGGLAGALYGYEAIPREWLNILLRRDYIEELCDNAAQSWSK